MILYALCAFVRLWMTIVTMQGIKNIKWHSMFPRTWRSHDRTSW